MKNVDLVVLVCVDLIIHIELMYLKDDALAIT